jgi:predicted Zn-dependent protease with MMP-like domain
MVATASIDTIRHVRGMRDQTHMRLHHGVDLSRANLRKFGNAPESLSVYESYGMDWWDVRSQAGKKV